MEQEIIGNEWKWLARCVVFLNDCQTQCKVQGINRAVAKCGNVKASTGPVFGDQDRLGSFINVRAAGGPIRATSILPSQAAFKLSALASPCRPLPSLRQRSPKLCSKPSPTMMRSQPKRPPAPVDGLAVSASENLHNADIRVTA
jgi:hypothetical protein